jgi:hypothetical protein
MPYCIARASGVLLMAVLALGGCAGSGTVASAISKGQSEDEVNRKIGSLQPTERLVANADARLLWQATSGYMDRAFPLDEIPAGVLQAPGQTKQLRTKLVEWTGDGLPHRTRVFVELRPDPTNAANLRLRVTALMVEPEPQLEQARPGEQLEYSWRLVGSNTRIEETVADQIMRRYLALREGKPLPIDEELIVPVRKTETG